jgi:hypothetical protein
VENGDAELENVAGLKPWRQFMVEARIQRVQQALCEQEGKGFPRVPCPSPKSGGRYD